MMDTQITVTVLVRATWTPDLAGDTEYPTMDDYAARVREQFAQDPLAALGKLPDPRVVETSVDTHP